MPVPHGDLLRYGAEKEQKLLSTGVQRPVFTEINRGDDDDTANASSSTSVTAIRSVIALRETVIPPFSKIMVQGVFTAHNGDLLPDGHSRNFVYLPPDVDSKAAAKFGGLGLWLGLRTWDQFSCRRTPTRSCSSSQFTWLSGLPRAAS